MLWVLIRRVLSRCFKWVPQHISYFDSLWGTWVHIPGLRAITAWANITLRPGMWSRVPCLNGLGKYRSQVGNVNPCSLSRIKITNWLYCKAFSQQFVHCFNVFQRILLQRTLQEVYVYMQHHQTHTFACTMLMVWIIVVWSWWCLH